MTDTSSSALPFWKTKSLAQMTVEEWESLCDGCGKCCLSKIEDEDSGEIHYTSVACRLFDEGSCRCTDYPNRSVQVPDCVTLTVENVPIISWLPSTCAYRLVQEGRDLYPWHHLVCGDRDAVHTQNVSIRGKVTAIETELVEPEDYFDHILDREP
jgi:uncharacterized cysteine cluster protein YcgN (CxxCxxCC family)